MQGGSLSTQEAEDILQSAEADSQIRIEVASETAQQVGSTGQQQRCGLCGTVGHNARTCERRQESITIMGYYVGQQCSSSSSNSQILVFW